MDSGLHGELSLPRLVERYPELALMDQVERVAYLARKVAQLALELEFRRPPRV